MCDGPLDRDDGRRGHSQPLATAPVEPTQCRQLAGRSGRHGNQTEGLRSAEFVRQERRHRARSSIRADITAHDQVRTELVRGQDCGQRCGDLGTRCLLRHVETHHTRHADGEQLAQRLLGLHRPGAHHDDRHGVCTILRGGGGPDRGGPQRDLDRGEVRLRDAGPMGPGLDRAVQRIDLGTEIRPLHAHGDQQIAVGTAAHHPASTNLPLTRRGRRRRGRPRGRSR